MLKSYKHFHAISKFAIDNLLYVSGVGYIVNNPDFIIDRKYFDDFYCVYVLNGIFHLEQNGKHYKVKKGQCVILDLRVKHKYYFTKLDCGEILWMHFNGINCKTLTNNLELPYIYASDLPRQIIKNCVLLITIKPQDYELEISKNVYNLLMDIVLKSDMPYEDIDPLIKKVDRFLVENRSKPITLDMLSKHTNISKYHLCRIFKKKTNKTPIQYILFKKIEYAKDLMLFSNAKVTCICKQLGFTDQSHFSKAFKRIIGEYPTEFKKKHY